MRFDHVADIEELVVPDIQPGEPQVENLHDVRHDATGHRRDRLLAHRRERDQALVDLIAASLLVIGDHRAKGGVLLGNEALVPPHLGRRGRRVGDMGPCQRASGGKPYGTAKYRAPRQHGHLRLLDLQACGIGYFEKIASARLNALSIACSGVIPLFITSSIATLKTCSELTPAMAGLNAS